jgi:hypothetical protein
VPDERDIQVVRLFVGDVVRTYGVVSADGRTARVVERERLAAAIVAFNERGHPERIVNQYASANDDDLRDAGLYGEQLRSKQELARLASDDLLIQDTDSPTPTSRLKRFSRPGIRRWIKRCKVLIGSLKGMIPAAEALNELLDLLDAALDRA